MSGQQKKNGFLRFLEKLHNPPNWIAVLAVATTLIICPLIVLAIVFDYGHGVAATIGLIICALLCIYTLTVTVSSIVRSRKKLIKVADRYAFTRKLYKSYEFRTLFFGIFAFLMNVGYTVFLIVTAIVYDSAWYGTIGVYYILLVVARGGVLFQNRKDEKSYKDEPKRLQIAKVGTYRYCGIMMLVLAVSLAFSVLELLVESASYRFSYWPIYVFAIVAAYKVFNASIHLVHASKSDDLAVRSVRYINLAATLMSVLLLQTAIVAAYPPRAITIAFVNGITGAIVCLITLAIGLYTVLHSVKVKKRLLAKKEETESDNGREIEN